MSDVDAILAGGLYVDRRGSRWERTDQGGYTQWWSEDEWPCIEHADMRLRIVRDLHREVCPGLQECETHPRTQVWREVGSWRVGDGWAVDAFPTFAEAIDAAQQLAGGTT